MFFTFNTKVNTKSLYFSVNRNKRIAIHSGIYYQTIPSNQWFDSLCFADRIDIEMVSE